MKQELYDFCQNLKTAIESLGVFDEVEIGPTGTMDVPKGCYILPVSVEIIPVTIGHHLEERFSVEVYVAIVGFGGSSIWTALDYSERILDLIEQDLTVGGSVTKTFVNRTRLEYEQERTVAILEINAQKLIKEV